MSMSIAAESTTNQCKSTFDTCLSANRIKIILNRYGKLMSTTNLYEQSHEEWDKKINALLENCEYSNIQLFDDFNHIKSFHNVNVWFSSPSKFNTFYNYLFDSKCQFQCELNHCQSIQKYYNQSRNTTKTYRICKIHTYFIHSTETMYKRTVAVISPDEYNGMLLFTYFVNQFIKHYEKQYLLFIPQSLVLLILDHLGAPMKINKQVTQQGKFEIKFQSIPPKITMHNNMKGLGYDNLQDLTPQNIPKTSMLLDTLLKVYSEKYMEFMPVLASITTDYSYIYFTSPVNFKIWQEFRIKSYIEVLISQDEKINEDIAIRIIENLNLVSDEHVIKSYLAPQLIGNTFAGIKNAMIFNEIGIPSLFSLFGLPDDGNEKIGDVLSVKITRGIHRLMVQPSKYQHRKCKVYDISCRADFNTYGYELDLDIFLPGHIQCRFATKAQHDMWMHHLKKT
eukprot:554679_1